MINAILLVILAILCIISAVFLRKRSRGCGKCDGCSLDCGKKRNG